MLDKEIFIPGSGIAARINISNGTLYSSAMPKGYDIESIDVKSLLWEGNEAVIKLHFNPVKQMDIDWEEKKKATSARITGNPFMPTEFYCGACGFSASQRSPGEIRDIANNHNCSPKNKGIK